MVPLLLPPAYLMAIERRGGVARSWGGMEPKDPQSRIPVLPLSQRMICDEQNGLIYNGGA